VRAIFAEAVERQAARVAPDSVRRGGFWLTARRSPDTASSYEPDNEQVLGQRRQILREVRRALRVALERQEVDEQG